MIGKVRMEASRKNMIEMLSMSKRYLKTLTDKELFEMGIKLGFWEKKNGN